MSRPSTLDARFEAALGHCLAGTKGRASGWCVALSGGLDSTLLLQVLVSLPGAARNLPVRAIHVNHGLHADATDWAASCALLAASLGVPCGQIVVDARPAPGESPEAAARRARYAAFAGEMRPGELLLTAHHADDQLETVMLQWLRGGGLRALSGMPRVNEFAGGWQARPLLEFTRAEIRDWAGALQLRWLEDPSNLDPRFDRNYLRLEVLPAIRRRWPSAAKTAQRVADFVADAVDLEEAVAAEELDRVARGVTLPVAALRELETPRRRAVLRAWLRALGLPVPSAATLAALQRDMLVAAADRIPCTRWPGASVRRYRDRLFASPEDAAPGWRPGPFHPATAGGAEGAGSGLELLASDGEGLSAERLPAGLELRFRTGGERFQPRGSGQGRELRKWLQEQGVLPWRRAAIPLLCAGDEVLAVGDLAVCERLAARPGEPSLRPLWRGRPVLTEAEALVTPLFR